MDSSWQDGSGLMQTQQIAAAVPNVVSLWEQNNTAPFIWYESIELGNAFFSISIKNEDQKQLVLTQVGQQYTLAVYSQGHAFCFLCHNVNWREQGHMDILQNTGSLFWCYLVN